MRKALIWCGGLLLAAGLVVLGGSAVMISVGLNPTYNLGDPGKLQFILVPFWAIGLAVTLVGAVCYWGGRRLKAA